MAVWLSLPVNRYWTVSGVSWIGPERYLVSGGTSSAGGGGPTNSKAPMSQRPFCGRVVPRWSVSAHGVTPASMARLPQWSRCVIVGPPLSAIASMVKFLLKRSRRAFEVESLFAGTARKHLVSAGSGGSASGGTSWRPPGSLFPPSEVTNQSQLPPLRLPPTIELRTITATFALGGTSGEKSDSTTPMPPPRGAEFRQTVRLTSFSSPSASWKRPPPPVAAVLPEMVVFSMNESPSARLKISPP